MSEELTARTIAKGKCHICGADVFIAEMVGSALVPHNSALVFQPKSSGQMVLHAEPICSRFLAADPDEFSQQCKLVEVDPLVEALDGILK